MPHGLAEWQAFLSEKNLPILLRTKKNVEKLVARQQLSITRYAEPIIYDAGFCVQLMRHVNTQRVAAGRMPLTTLDNALSHFGQDSFNQFLQGTQVFEEMSLAEANRRGYLRVMEQACHGALQAKDWSQQRNVMQPEETQLATQIQALTELMLWCYGDSLMPQLEELCYVKQQSYESASQQLLGCTMKQLGHVLAEQWQLPEMTIDALSDRANDFTLSTGVSLAYELARVVSLNWYGERAQQVLQKIAAYKGKKQEEIERRIHLNVVEMTPHLLQYGYQTPARLLPQLADDSYVYSEYALQQPTTAVEDLAATPAKIQAEVKTRTSAKTQTSRSEAGKKSPRTSAVKKQLPSKNSSTTQQTGSKKPPAKIPDSAESGKARAVVQHKPVPATPAAKIKPASDTAISAELAADIRQFQKMVNNAAAAHDLIEHMVKASIHCGVKRCVFLVKVPDKQVLITRFMAYAENVDKIKPFKIITDRPNIFSLLLEKTRSLFLNEANRGKYWNSIPDSARLVLGCRQFFSMSIFVKEHAMGIMYADKIVEDMSEAEFKQFQALCRLLSKGIVQSAQNKHKKAEAAAG